MSQKTPITEEKARQLIENEVKSLYKDAHDFRYERVGEDFLDGDTYYLEFKAKGISSKDSYYYAYINAEGVKLFENGKQTIVHMQGQLEKRKNIVQRLKDFDFLDIIGSLIALPIIFSFIYIVIIERGSPESISKEYLTIVSLILGYYFGRNKVK